MLILGYVVPFLVEYWGSRRRGYGRGGRGEGTGEGRRKKGEGRENGRGDEADRCIGEEEGVCGLGSGSRGEGGEVRFGRILYLDL